MCKILYSCHPIPCAGRICIWNYFISEWKIVIKKREREWKCESVYEKAKARFLREINRCFFLPLFSSPIEEASSDWRRERKNPPVCCHSKCRLRWWRWAAKVDSADFRLFILRLEWMNEENDELRAEIMGKEMKSVAFGGSSSFLAEKLWASEKEDHSLTASISLLQQSTCVSTVDCAYIGQQVRVVGTRSIETTRAEVEHPYTMKPLTIGSISDLSSWNFYAMTPHNSPPLGL